jgi:14-3-3 protein epsilon
MTQASGFNLPAFKSLFTEERSSLVQLARLAEASERYEDMSKIMRSLVEWTSTQTTKPDLTIEERNLMSVAYKNVVGARRTACRALHADEHKDNNLAKLYLKQVEGELENWCKDAVDLIQNHLLKNNSEENEARVFYLKMAGDYYRYLAEFVTDQSYEVKARDMYQQATAVADKKLAATHPIRLGLALNHSVCLFEIVKDKKAACDLAKKAFDEAISKLDKIGEAEYKDSTLIMQLIRDNLALWSSEAEPEAAP